MRRWRHGPRHHHRAGVSQPRRRSTPRWAGRRDHDGDRTRETRRREAYRHDIDLDQQLAMEAGTNQVFPFALQTPQHRHQPAQQPGSTWGRLVATLGEVGSRNSEFIWEIESRYDIPGLDLAASERLNLDLEL